MTDNNEPVLVESRQERENVVTGLVVVAAIAAGLGAALMYKVFGSDIAGWIGAAGGFGLSLLVRPIRVAVFQFAAGITIFVLAIGAIIFILDTF